MSKLKNTISRLLRRSHPDIYEAAKSYADEKGIKLEDVQAAALTAYLASDDEGKQKLEEAIEKSRVEGRGSPQTNIKNAIEMFRDMTSAMGEMFKAMNEARSSLSMSSMLADYRAAAEAAKEIKKLGGEGGTGSMDDMIANWFLSRMFGSIDTQKPVKKTGKTPIEVHGEEEK
jgi:hypothetical protein